MANKSGRSTKSRKSVASHPLFPVVVALWFGAIFGLGSLAIRLQVLEDLARASRIDLLIPAAGPPFGMTARLLLATALAGIGGAIGAAIARKIARPKASKRERRRPAAPATQAVNVRPRDAHPDAPARKPISASEELNAAAIASLPTQPEEQPAMRRRSLALPDAPPTDFVEFAPLPGEDEYTPDVSEVMLPEALDLAAFSPTSAIPEASVTPVLPEPVAPAPAVQSPVYEGLSVEPPVVAEGRSEPLLAAAPLAELGSSALMERLAKSLRRRKSQAMSGQAAEVAPSLQVAAPPVIDTLPRLLRQPIKADVESEPEAVVPAPIKMPLALRPIELGSLDDDAAVDELPLRHLGFIADTPSEFDGSAIDGLAASLALSSELASLPDDNELAATDEAEEAYSSLLDMDVLPSLPRQDFIRIEEDEPVGDAIEPVVIFPGQSPLERAEPAPVAEVDALPEVAESAAPTIAALPQARDPEETERALRAALASLQRMSGAA